MSRWRSAKQERAHLIKVMRAEGMSWVEIACDFQERYQVHALVAFRLAHGLSQDQVAEKWNKLWPDEPRTFQNISTWERWPQSGHEPSLTTLGRLAEIYRCDLSDLVAGVFCFRHLDPAYRRSQVGSVVVPLRRSDSSVGAEAPTSTSLDPEVDPMDISRRRFTAGTAAMLSSMGLPVAAFANPGSHASEVVDIEQLRQLERAVEQLERDDAALGGGSVLDTATVLHDQVTRWITEQAYASQTVGAGLRSLSGDLCQWRGWLAFDAERLNEAFRYTEQAIVHARLVDDPVLETQALNCMCQLLIRDGRAVESLDCAEAAQRAARGWATPRVTALLHLRAARAHASLREQRLFAREVANAKAQLDRGPRVDDPLFVQFMTPQELACVEGLSHLAMGHAARATSAFEDAVTTPVERRRNHAYYTVWRAAAAARHHDVHAASDIGLAAIPLVRSIASPRTVRPLQALRAAIEPHRTSIDIADRFACTYDEVLA